jgi:hypothetical protein
MSDESGSGEPFEVFPHLDNPGDPGQLGAAWRLHHPERKKTVKVHHSMHDVDVWARAHVTHGIRHTILRPAFWLGMTLGFPLEHLLWEKAPVFSAITRWLGL